MKKIVTVVGARPQFIKVAPLSRELRKSHMEILINTGQHYDINMSEVFFEELEIPKPDYNLDIGSGSHGSQTGGMLKKIECVLKNEKPDGVLVYGDTNSTLAGALAASKMHIPVIHVEAGLRSFNKKMPEEINRKLTDHVSDLLCAPTEIAVTNLQNEGINTNNVHLTGDVMYDAFLYNTQLAKEKEEITKIVPNESYYLATIHRAENTDYNDKLETIVKALHQLDRKVILPLHPRTKSKLEQFGLTELVGNSRIIHAIEPVSYLQMIALEGNAETIITDSGGVQKEAYFAGVPCFTLREQTEWEETIMVGWNQLVNPKNESLLEVIKENNIPKQRTRLYGEGNAADKIKECIDNHI